MTINIEISKRGGLVVNDKLKVCMYDVDKVCNIQCAQFSEPVYAEPMVKVHLCHNKTWTCAKENFKDRR